MTAPFTDAKFPEVLARVAYQWVRLTYKRRMLTKDDGVLCVGYARDDLGRLEDGPLGSPLLALQFHLIRGGESRVWLSRAITHSRAGLGFRRCWYDDYKANRRNPRVTNRGVRPPSKRRADG